MKIDTNKIKIFLKKYIRGFIFVILHIEFGHKKEALKHLQNEFKEIEELETKVKGK